MTSSEHGADRLRHHMAAEHPTPAGLLDWHLLQPSEQRLWIGRAEAVLGAHAVWRIPEHSVSPSPAS